MDFLVGTFNHPSLYHFTFTPSTSTLNLTTQHPALSGHSWLSLSPSRSHLYATSWTSPPCIASYTLSSSGQDLKFLNQKTVKAIPGYVCCNSTHVFSISGPSGEVFERKGEGGGLGDLVQTLEFVGEEEEEEEEGEGEKRGDVVVKHGDFGGLRHGAHSGDLSPDGKRLYVADIGRNCIWIYKVLSQEERERKKEKEGGKVLEFGRKCVAPRLHDGPRHTFPHPNGKILYSLQEHSSMVDVFSIAEDGITLTHLQGCAVLPESKDCKDFWADEVRVSTGPDAKRPRYLYASNRGLEKDTKGYVVVYKLKEDGTLESEEALDIFETPTSGGIANAIEVAPWREEDGGLEFLALCDSEEGWVSVLSFDGRKIKEVAKVNLGRTKEGEVIEAATPVWL